MSEVTVGAYRFKIAPLPPDRSLDGLTILVQRVLPSLASGIDFAKSEVKPEVLFPEIAKAAASLPEIYQLFLPYVEFYREGPGTPGWFQLSTPGMAAQLFARKSYLILGLLAAALTEEYGSFLSEDGRSLIGATVNRLTSLLVSIGGSGG